jgi:hypothetical protein
VKGLVKFTEELWKEVFEIARGSLLHNSLEERKHYEHKSNLELFEVLKEQVLRHYVESCVGTEDDIQLYTVEGLLMERGLPEQKLQEIKAEAFMYNELWNKFWESKKQIQKDRCVGGKL